MSIELKPREWLLALWANGTFTVEAEDAPCWQAIAPPEMIRAVAALPVEETIKALRAALAAAEAKLADAEKHAEALYRALVDLRLVCDMVERPAVEARVNAIFAAHAARRKEEAR